MIRDSGYLESVLHHDIPLTQDMGLKVLSWQAHQLRLHLPLPANINHKSTMFGGSLYCGAVLAGWGWLHLSLLEAHVLSEWNVVVEHRLQITTVANHAGASQSNSSGVEWLPLSKCRPCLRSLSCKVLRGTPKASAKLRRELWERSSSAAIKLFS